MAKIELFGDNLLLEKVKQESKSEFEIPNDAEPWGAIYKVVFAGPDSPAKAGDQVILKPGSYENLMVNGKTYLHAAADEIAGRIA